MISPNHILREVLEIIHYDGDVEAYTEQFIDLCKFQAAQTILKDSPGAEQHMVPDVYERVLEEVSQKNFQEFLLKIHPKLNDEERKNLEEYLKTLARTYPA